MYNNFCNNYHIDYEIVYLCLFKNINQTQITQIAQFRSKTVCEIREIRA